MQPVPQGSEWNEQRIGRLLRLSAGTIIGVLLLYVVAVSWYSWRSEKADAVNGLVTVAELEARAIDGYFTHLELDLRRLCQELAPDEHAIDLDRAFALVKLFKELHSELYNVTLIQADGKVLLTARNPPGTTQASLGKESSFIGFVESVRRGQDFEVGQPLVAVVSKVVIVPVRIVSKDRDGATRFILSANLPQEYLRSFWSDTPITTKAAIGLMRDNGYLLSRFPVPANLSMEEIYGKPRSGALIHHLREGGFPKQGTVEGPSSLDGPDFLNAFRRLPNYPMTLFVALPISEVRAAWWSRMSGTYLSLAILVIGGFAAYRYAIHQHRLAVAEQKGRLEAMQETAAVEGRLQRIAGHVPGIVFELRRYPDGRTSVPYANDAFRDIFRLDPKDVRDDATPLFSVVHPDDQQELQASISASASALTPWRHQYRLAFDGEREIWLEGNAVPQREAVGSTIWHGFISDVTERKKAEALLERTKAELTVAQEIARIGNWRVVFGKDGDEWFGSDELYRIYGHPPGMRLTMHSGIEAMHPEDQASVAAAWSDAAAGTGAKEWEHRIVVNGQLKWISVRVQFVMGVDGAPVEAIGICQDITDRKAVDVALEDYKNHLENMVESRTAALTIAKEAAESATRAKSAFLATMSHELRTPLNGIMGMTELARFRASDPKQIDYLDKAADASARLLAIIQDVLDIARIEANRLNLEITEFELGKLLDTVTDSFARAVAGRNLDFSVTASPPVLARQSLRGDSLRLGQVLLNLVSNALKFTERGSVAVRAMLVEDHPTSMLLRFEVEDTGIGISPADQARVFDMFEQADSSSTRRYGGAGVGLAICRQLVQLMDGQIGVESRVGAGSTFWIVVRLEKAVHQATMAPSPSALGALDQLRAAHASARVLVAEDDALNRNVVRELLEQAGFVVAFAHDGAEAVAMASRTTYDLILMDVKMPVLDGIEATRRIRQSAHNPRVPIVALTANVFPEDERLCREAGMNGFIGRPVHSEVMFEVLLKWLDHSTA